MLATLSVFVDGLDGRGRRARLRAHRGRDARSARCARRAQPRERRSRPTPGRGSACSHPSGSSPPSGSPPARTGPTSSGGTRSTSARSWRTPTGPRNDRPSGPSACEPRRRTCGSPSAGSSPTTSRRCRTCSAILWLFWQMRDRMPEGRAWIDELRLHEPTRWTTARRPRCCSHRPSRRSRSATTTSALAAVEGIERLEGRVDDPYLRERAAAGRLVDPADRRRLRRRAAGRVDGARRLPPAERAVRGVRGADRRHAGDDARPTTTPRARTSPRSTSSAASSATTGSSRVHERSSPRSPCGPATSTRPARCWWSRWTRARAPSSAPRP